MVEFGRGGTFRKVSLQKGQAWRVRGRIMHLCLQLEFNKYSNVGRPLSKDEPTP